MPPGKYDGTIVRGGYECVCRQGWRRGLFPKISSVAILFYFILQVRMCSLRRVAEIKFGECIGRFVRRVCLLIIIIIIIIIISLV